MTQNYLWNDIFYYKYDDQNQSKFHSLGYCVLKAYDYQSNSEKIGIFKVGKGPEATENTWNLYSEITKEKSVSRRGNEYLREFNKNQPDFEPVENQMPIYFNSEKPHVITHIKNKINSLYEELTDEDGTIKAKVKNIALIEIIIFKKNVLAIVVANIDSRTSIGIMSTDFRVKLDRKKLLLDTWYSSDKLSIKQNEIILDSKEALVLFDSKEKFKTCFDKIYEIIKDNRSKKSIEKIKK